MADNIDMDELERRIEAILNDMDKHFSQEHDKRWVDWDVNEPHVKLGRPQEVHGRRPGKRKMVLALRAAAKAQGEASTIPKWNDLIRMGRSEIYQIGQRHFKGKFDDALKAIPESGAGVNPRVDDIPNSVKRPK